MEGAYNKKYAFIGEWYDNQANVVRRYDVYYYPVDDTLEMYDLNMKKRFVKRVKVNGVDLGHFHIGATIPILGRLIKIVDFACEDTRKSLQLGIEVTFALIKPTPNNTIVGQIITYLYKNGYKITKMKKSVMTVDDINTMYGHMINNPLFPALLDYLTHQHVYGMELTGYNAVEAVQRIIGDPDPAKAAPGTPRALFGINEVRNCIDSSLTKEQAAKDLEYFFPANPSSQLHLTATLSNCTLCIIKPHAIREGKLGLAIEQIDQAGYDVTALFQLVVEIVNASEFYEVYKGIVSEYQGMVEELASGQCVAMEIVAKNKQVNTAVEFRKFVGPTDPEIARLLRPHTLRAQFGNTKIQNAVHCSDLAEDGLLEVEYFFKILSI